MTGGSCGCATRPCGCCDGVAPLTPVAIDNRPGLDAVVYRVGTQAQFFETMQARLSSIRVDGVGPDGQTVQTWQPLQALTTRDRSDLSIALLDGWATVADVLTFYQERIANEGFLRTATERRSVLELARLIGYTLRPGVAATVYLAYTLDDKQTEPTVIAAGARSQSVPAPGESAQSFETSEDLVARAAWNNLQVRLHRSQNITLDHTLTFDGGTRVADAFADLQARGFALTVATIQVAGTATNLRPGDKLLLTFSDDGSSSVVRTVASIETAFSDQRTAIALQPVDPAVVVCAALLPDFIDQLVNFPTTDERDDDAKVAAIAEAESILRDVLLGLTSAPELVGPQAVVHTTEGAPSFTDGRNPSDWTVRMVAAAERAFDGNIAVPWAPVLGLDHQIHQLVSGTGGTKAQGTDPGKFIPQLLLPAVPQVANTLHLTRDLATSFALRPTLAHRVAMPGTTAASPEAPQADASPQLLVQFAPILRDSLYRAWSSATVNTTSPSLKNVYALRARTTLFGAGASRIPAFFTDTASGHVPGQLMPPNKWTEDWSYADDEAENNAFLDQAYEAIAPGSYVLVHVGAVPGNTAGVSASPPTRQVLQVAEVAVAPRSEYGLSGPSTALAFSPATSWRSPVNNQTPIATLRRTQIYAQSEALTLIDEPITDPVGGPDPADPTRTTIELGNLYNELKSGRWVILSGERADIPDVSGVQAAELLMLSTVTHGFDPGLPGDQTHTTLILATPTAYQYKRETLAIYGNVVKATHGETRSEILGSGDGAQSLPSFSLKQPPLTFVAAPTAAGAESTLRVFVDNVEWHEADSLAGLGPKDHGFVTATDDAGTPRVTFGDGVHGARLATGVQNVTATYRSGIGVGGNVKAEQISLLQTRPLGVMSVINPLGASGGADREPRDLARENAPLSVLPLDRLVSLADHAAFTRNFAGIAKAIAQRVSDGKRQLIYLTIAGADDIPIDPSSDLYRNLLAAYRKLGDPDLPVQVDRRELTALVLSAGVKILPDFQWEPVASAIRARLLDAFGFGKRALGQPAQRCEVLGVMQNVRGVAYVDIDAFGGVTEKTVKITDQGTRTRVLRTPSDIAAAVEQSVQRAVGGRFTCDRVDAFPGGVDHGELRPAELVIFTPAVPDTLILNQLP